MGVGGGRWVAGMAGRGTEIYCKRNKFPKWIYSHFFPTSCGQETNESNDAQYHKLH